MKRFVSISVVALLLLFTTAQAQGNWFGVRTGYPLGGTLHYGIENALSNGFDLRVGLNLSARGNSLDFGLGVDALNTVYIERPFEVYVGGGLAVDFGGGGTLLDAHGLAGGEFRFTDVGLSPLGLFAELSLGAAIGIGRSSIIPSFGGGLGINWHF